jgi:hypothetical protein
VVGALSHEEEPHGWAYPQDPFLVDPRHGRACSGRGVGGAGGARHEQRISRPAKGTYVGLTDGAKQITVKVKKHRKVTVNFCNKTMSGKVRKKSGRFSVADFYPGILVKGHFPDRETAAGTIPIDSSCGSPGSTTWTATRQ